MWSISKHEAECHADKSCAMPNITSVIMETFREKPSGSTTFNKEGESIKALKHATLERPYISYNISYSSVSDLRDIE